MLQIIRAEIGRRIILARSYWADYVGDLVLYLVGFLFLMGVYYVAAGENFTPTIFSNTLIGYVTWKICADGFESMAKGVIEEGKTGTLEQLFSSGPNPALILSVRSVVQYLDFAIRGIFLGGVIALILGIIQAVPFWSVLFFLITAIGTFGVGLALVGLALTSKRVDGITVLIWQMLIFFSGALAPIGDSTVLGYFSKLLPLTWGIKAIRLNMVDSVSFQVLWQNGLVSGLLINTAFYFVLGIIVFRWGLNSSRKLGTIGQY